ncbi:Protein of unknown function [Gryllus bimaculatus]|nr:Protein of unknown function [Gryllus bimaculatus]
MLTRLHYGGARARIARPRGARALNSARKWCWRATVSTRRRRCARKCLRSSTPSPKRRSCASNTFCRLSQGRIEVFPALGVVLSHVCVVSKGLASVLMPSVWSNGHCAISRRRCTVAKGQWFAAGARRGEEVEQEHVLVVIGRFAVLGRPEYERARSKEVRTDDLRPRLLHPSVSAPGKGRLRTLEHVSCKK